MNEDNFRERLKKTGRNDVCPCGSGKKYKKCHLREDESAVQKDMQSKKETEEELSAQDNEKDRGEQSTTHFDDQVRQKLKLKKTVVRLNVPRRQAGK